MKTIEKPIDGNDPDNSNPYSINKASEREDMENSYHINNDLKSDVLTEGNDTEDLIDMQTDVEGKKDDDAQPDAS